MTEQRASELPRFSQAESPRDSRPTINGQRVTAISGPTAKRCRVKYRVRVCGVAPHSPCWCIRPRFLLPLKGVSSPVAVMPVMTGEYL
jgi:hypothetical protein